MTKLFPKITGRFQVRIGAEILEYSDYSQIPDSFDNLITFEPDMPKPPHTIADHAWMASLPGAIAALMKRERKYARRNSNR